MGKLRVAITAAGSGIGRAIAESYLATGAQVYVCDVNESALESFLDANPTAVAMKADVANPGEVDEFFDRIASDGPTLDILINNAGISGPTGPLETLEIEDWQQTINVDLNSMFYCSTYWSADTRPPSGSAMAPHDMGEKVCVPRPTPVFCCLPVLITRYSGALIA